MGEHVDIALAAAKEFRVQGARRVGRRFYWEANLRHGSDDCFYSGFSQDITRSGVFVATYDIRPIGTEAAVRVIFDGLDDFGVDCAVEWVREPHPVVDDVPPGMGLRFKRFDPEFAARFYAHIAEHPPYFLDVKGAPVSQSGPRTTLESSAAPLLDGKSLEALDQIRERLAQFSQVDADLSATYEEPVRPGAVHRGSAVCRVSSHGSENAAPLSIRSALDVDAFLDVSPTSEHFDRQFRGGFEDEDGLLVAFLRSAELRPVGSRIAVNIISGGQEVGALIGRVRWRRRVNPTLGHTGSPPGMGVRFDEVVRGTAEGLGALWGRGCPVFQEI